MNRVESVRMRARALELVKRYPELSYSLIARRLGVNADYVGHVARTAGIDAGERKRGAEQICRLS